MRLVALDLNSGDLGEIEPVLRSLAESPDRVAAANGQMLLALVSHLQASGPEPVVVAQLLLGELILWPASAPYPAPAQVAVRPDWYDYGPRDGEMPRMHYRLNVRQEGRPLSTDIRTQELDWVERALQDAFGWKR